MGVSERVMYNLKSLIRLIRMTIMAIALIYGSILWNCQSVIAIENESEGKKEYITGRVYQFEQDDGYDLSTADEYLSTEDGSISGGRFSISGDIDSITEMNGFPSYSVSGGTLSFSYMYNDTLLYASKDEEHLVDDDSNKLNRQTLNSEIKKGVLLVQTSKDGHIWFNVPGSAHTNVFRDNPNGLTKFYTTTDVQMLNGCYYRIIVAYKTAIRTQKAQVYPPQIEKYAYKKYAEVFCFYAYDKTAIDTKASNTNNNRLKLGSKVRTNRTGYDGSAEIDNKDLHFGWDIGQFFVSGFTQHVNGNGDNTIFLKKRGDRICLWFELEYDIDKCYENDAIKVIADPKGVDKEFEVPGGANQYIDFGRGALIIRKINPDNTKEKPVVFTNFLEASASTDAVTIVNLFEEGDYEVALDYAVKYDKKYASDRIIIPETAKYRIPFKFSVRNGNSMVFIFDAVTGSELSGGAITENGFRLDFANSKYLNVTVKREVLKDGYDGLTEDTRFNSVAADGDVFTDEGVYTITVTNQYYKNENPTEKKVYVGKDNILKAYMVNDISISEIKEMIASGATIADDGTIIVPGPENGTGTGTNTSSEPSEAGKEEKPRKSIFDLFKKIKDDH